MQRVATVAHLGRYPVKSMRGEAPAEAPVGWNGLLGDRRYAFVRADTTSPFPWMTGRQAAEYLLYEPCFAAAPTPDEPEPPLWVHAPTGARYEIVDPALRIELETRFGHPLFLLHTGRGAFDADHVSLFSLASLRELSKQAGLPLVRQRFRANLYLEPETGIPFAEEDWIGSMLRVGEGVRLAITRRNKRCAMTTIDPATAATAPAVLRTIVERHDGCAGLYASVLATGTIRVGDGVYLEHP